MEYLITWIDAEGNTDRLSTYSAGYAKWWISDLCDKGFVFTVVTNKIGE